MDIYNKIIAEFARFRADEAGAVTVDYVVLTAAIVGIAVAVVSSIADGSMDLAGDVSGTIAAVDIGSEGGGSEE